MTTSASLPPASASPLRLPLFRAVWIASLCSNFGGLVQSVGASWMMAGLGGSARMVALVQTSTTLPIMLLSLWAGAVADNLDRRRVMLAAQVFMLAVSVALAAGTWLGLVTPALLLAATFLIGCGTAINGPAWQASVGDMVPRAVLPGAVAYNSMGFNIARSLGPAIGGAIVAAAGAAAAFLLNAVSYVGLIAVLGRWRPDLPPRRLPRERLGIAMAAGVRYVGLSPQIRTVLVRAALFGVAASALPALMPVLARDRLGGSPLVYGALLCAFGIGAVAGALGSARLRTRVRPEPLVRIASLALAAGAIGTGLAGSLPLAVPALLLGGAGWVAALSTFNIGVQLASPRWVVARAIALYQMAAFGGMAIGSWIFGSLAAGHGVAVSLLVAGAVQLAGAAVGFALPLPDLDQRDLSPYDRWREPDTVVPVQPRSGPIVITIENRVAEADVPEFLTVMAARRRIRSRDGARHWTLLRDLAEADLWIERFHFATWIDYVRHNDRRTIADHAVAAAVERLRIPGSAHVVHRRIERQVGSLPHGRALPVEKFDPVTDPSRST